ncbi:MAG: hisA [Dehalococcoidia bacterium]|nr:hisA [Dehalococcoidia bacterium]
MEIIPAIDLRGGRCVRLYQGDYAQETVFASDPVEMALHWESLGAPRLHLVDLDAAATGERVNIKAIESIVRAIKIPVQVGGGIRSVEAVKETLDLGAERAILGTVSIEDPLVVEEACQRFGDAVVVGVDARNGAVATRGWRETTDIPATQHMTMMVSLGVQRIIYTDISRDGTLTEPNYGAMAEAVEKVRAFIVASGGVSRIEHIQRLKVLGVEAAIVGRALYEGTLDLKEALLILA